MRHLTKLPKPEILVNNEVTWLTEFLNEPTNKTKKYRYRHPDIKQQLKKETSSKCVYCESKIGHNTPGDIEHKIPSSKQPAQHFVWENLTIACTECNRRKNNYYVVGNNFIDPYTDDVEQMLEHHGPIVLSRSGDTRAEVSVRTLELNSVSRIDLFQQKIGKLNELTAVIERIVRETDPVLNGLLIKQMKEMAEISAEYSAMVLSVLRSKGML